MDFSHCRFGIVVSAMNVEGARGSAHGKKMTEGASWSSSRKRENVLMHLTCIVVLKNSRYEKGYILVSRPEFPLVIRYIFSFAF